MKKHEMHGMYYTKIYHTWEIMKRRCYRKNYVDYHRYGGRGIEVCDEWKNSFLAFYKDMGERPKGKTLDRINNDKGYSQENCKWSTPREQANNRRNNRFLTHKGKTLTVAQWARKLGVKDGILRYRLRKNWAIEEVLKK